MNLLVSFGLLLGAAAMLAWVAICVRHIIKSFRRKRCIWYIVKTIGEKL